MSTHLLIAAAYTEGLPQSTKLVLMAFADSADEHTLEAAPGLPKLRAWSGVSKQQVVKITTALTEAGYIERMTAGRLGRRAVYRVFPAGVPAIPHPDEVAARFADTQVVPNVDNAQSYPQDEVREGRTSAPHRGASGPSRGAPARPLQSLTSVSIGEPADNPPPPRVDKPLPRPSTASGFPGARPTATDLEALAGIRRRALGANNVPCPLHPEHVHPCGRCAHAAADLDAEHVQAARKTARDAIRKTRQARQARQGATTEAPAATTTEETRPA